MCGIIGKVSVGNVMPDLLNGLKKLEYRGYDSAGVAFFENGKITRVRCKGKIGDLEKIVVRDGFESAIAIGHTRWATHGEPTKENAHPHKSPNGKFFVVHNGIIENSEEIKNSLLHGDSAFESHTDTEVFAHLLEKYYKDEPVSAIAKAQAVLKGSYAFGILCSDFPQNIFAAASGSPLLVVKSEDSFSVASDSGAVYTGEGVCYRVLDGEICSLSDNGVEFFDAAGNKIQKQSESTVERDRPFDKEGYEHYMLKEIFEQPSAVKNTVDSLVSFGSISLQDVILDEDFLREKLKKITVIACGSAYHTGLVGKHVIEGFSGVPCTVEIASEFRYSEPLADESTLAIFVSQSGETADTLASLRLAKRCGAQILSIVNVRDSAIARESENVIFTKAGREVAVATTKAYSAQLVAFYAFGICLGRIKGCVTTEQEEKFTEELTKLSEKISDTLVLFNDKMKMLAQEMNTFKDAFFIGRLKDYATACEGALKLKEISYINAQSYTAGELKHGTISLIEEGTPVFAVAGESKVFSKTLSNICEVEARGARVIVITDNAKQSLVSKGRTVLAVPDTLPEFRPSLLIVPLQLLSYYIAHILGCDIDQPKNLAKSVTVE